MTEAFFSNATPIDADDRLAVVAADLPRGDGTTRRRLFVKHPGAVVILPLLDDGRVVLIRNHRPATGATLWELPAGTLEAGEGVAVCAARELVEETGYAAEHVQRLCSFFTAPGFCNEWMHAFVATGLRHVGQDLNDTERITVHPMPMPDALDMIRRGELADAKSMTTLLMYHLQMTTDR